MILSYKRLHPHLHHLHFDLTQQLRFHSLSLSVHIELLSSLNDDTSTVLIGLLPLLQIRSAINYRLATDMLDILWV